MPGRIGQRKGVRGLTIPQRERLNELVLVDGIGLGVHALHDTLMREMGEGAPTRNEIAEYKHALQSEQIARPPKSTTGENNSIAPVIPHPAIPMSSCWADTMFLPAAYHKKQVYLCCSYRLPFILQTPALVVFRK